MTTKANLYKNPKSLASQTHLSIFLLKRLERSVLVQSATDNGYRLYIPQKLEDAVSEELREQAGIRGLMREIHKSFYPDSQEDCHSEMVLCTDTKSGETFQGMMLDSWIGEALEELYNEKKAGNLGYLRIPYGFNDESFSRALHGKLQQQEKQAWKGR